ncbi:EI2BA-like protein [Mya arenaria]|uniref:EI2BA-like protein n=1 Tax=Mya arenaria TaxID=6604 RepID=A0ABY7E2J4_MYAAR|nr:EI2BA-like protein [Mya arenaria]
MTHQCYCDTESYILCDNFSIKSTLKLTIFPANVSILEVIFPLQIGTYSIAIAAKAMNKPFYVVAESFKFVRLFPLNQQDLPNEFKYKASTLRSGCDLSQEHPLVDYTPPAYISLLFTDLGVLTPSAVSDELIKLYC